MKAMATLLWPITALVAVVLFRDDVRGLIRRISHVRVFGQEADLRESIDVLAEVTSDDRLNASIETRRPEDGRTTYESQEAQEEQQKAQAAATKVIEQASDSPRLAILSLGTEIEAELRELAVGSTDRPLPTSMQAAIDMLLKEGRIPLDVHRGLQQFTYVRNVLVHRIGVDDNLMFRAIDSGIKILRILAAIPREIHSVAQPSLELFADPSCERLREDVHGLMLEFKRFPTDSDKTFRVFPTTRTDYRVGQRVAWNWNFGRIWSESWYRAPETAEPRLAFSSSAEFVGEPIS